MTKALRNIFLLGFVAALTACGGGGGGDSGGGSANGGGDTGGGGTNTPPEVTVQSLQGDWSGTFDDKSAVSTLALSFDNAGNITKVTVDGAQQSSTGTVSRVASDAARVFRFNLSDAGAPFRRGVLLVDPTGNYLVYLTTEFDFAVLQKAAPSGATFAKADIEKSNWTGDRFSTPSGGPSADFGTFASGSSSANCTAAATSSQCVISGSGIPTKTGVFEFNVSGDTSRGCSNTKGCWLASSYSEEPSATGAAARAYISADKRFAGGWTCREILNFSTCDFYGWKTP